MRRRLRDGTIVFKDWPEFRPNLTPREMFEQGAFGGTYWRRIHSRVTGRNHANMHRKYSWIRGIPEEMLSSQECDLSRNKYGVHSGTSLDYWESQGWIAAQDPYGWVQWYCEFYDGRRSPDDDRQIARWEQLAGPRGRFYRRLLNTIVKKRAKYNDFSVSPVIRQCLHHWAKVVTAADLRRYIDST